MLGRGYDVCIIAIDGAWRRSCVLRAISDNDTELTVEGSIQVLNLKELLSVAILEPALPTADANWFRVSGAESDILFPKSASRLEAFGRGHPWKANR